MRVQMRGEQGKPAEPPDPLSWRTDTAAPVARPRVPGGIKNWGGRKPNSRTDRLLVQLLLSCMNAAVTLSAVGCDFGGDRAFACLEPSAGRIAVEQMGLFARLDNGRWAIVQCARVPSKTLPNAPANPSKAQGDTLELKKGPFHASEKQSSDGPRRSGPGAEAAGQPPQERPPARRLAPRVIWPD